MSRIIILGNSWSGKTTLARKLGDDLDAAVLDLDTVAWQLGTMLPTRRSLAESEADMLAFAHVHERWIMEWSYASLARILMDRADGLYFLDVSVESCLERARTRAHEPHKFRTKEEQDAALGPLLDWITSYDERPDEYGRAAHVAIYDEFRGTKHCFRMLPD